MRRLSRRRGEEGLLETMEGEQVYLRGRQMGKRRRTAVC
jgi:hypothetical protein